MSDKFEKVAAVPSSFREKVSETTPTRAENTTETVLASTFGQTDETKTRYK